MTHVSFGLGCAAGVGSCGGVGWDELVAYM